MASIRPKLPVLFAVGSFCEFRKRFGMIKVALRKPSVVTWVSTKPPESAVGSGNSPHSPTKRLSAFLQWTSYSLRRLCFYFGFQKSLCDLTSGSC
ncbi:hypothetical protein RRG08_005576 [Elysia crispata]|uniref:Uncharacterized protein n=1 Tax=Elysia crispata TaxID=231223 RepID=A0AAE0YRR7_9GAST|nr:hypothetical protein RRG08_005576 [Elysia crispata]